MIKIIFCAFNEEKNLTRLLVDINQEMQNLGRDFEIIACLDGTTDNSSSLIENFSRSCKIKVLPLRNERGLGHAYKRIFGEIIENCSDDDLIISLDADNTHEPEQISELLQHLEKNNLDLVVASRFCDKSIMAEFPFYRQFISKFTSILLQKLFAVKTVSSKKLQDYTSGYRLYRASKIKELHQKFGCDFIREPEFTYTCELLIKLAKIGTKIDEIPISYDYSQKVGASKLRVPHNFYRLLIMLINLKIHAQ